jgi:hypothetical protein
LKLPIRPRDIKDPLAITYYRRLSLTEYLNQPSNGVNTFPAEAKEIERRRFTRNDIPFHTLQLPPSTQFRAPSSFVTEFLLPSYARHLAHKHKNDKPGYQLHSVRLYRVLHEIVPVERLGQPAVYTPLYEPATYLPYYMGEYLPDGKLKDNRDPLLYWLIPIERKPGKQFRNFEDADYLDHYDDGLYRHTGTNHTREWDVPAAK